MTTILVFMFICSVLLTVFYQLEDYLKPNHVVNGVDLSGIPEGRDTDRIKWIQEQYKSCGKRVNLTTAARILKRHEELFGSLNAEVNHVKKNLDS